MKTLNFFVVLLSFVFITSAAYAAEPWADKNLPVQSGLVTWLDAKVQPAAWKQHGRAEAAIADGQRLDVWYDASGNGFHLTQRLQDAQPLFGQVGELAYVRFDGGNDFLSRVGGQRRVSNLTAFIQAAARSNPGGFRAFLAAAALGKNDYRTGFNVDQGASGSALFETLNVEGAGFVGARNLLAGNPLPFNSFQLLEVHVEEDGVRGVLNGQAPGKRRDRQAASVSLDEITLGARLFSNTGQPPYVQGFLEGDVAEVLLYDRALSEAETAAVRNYLLTKYQGFNEALAAKTSEGGRRLIAVENPPPIQMLVPGFEVCELPLDLPNVNNVLYRPDGKLVALAYDGNLYLLSDTNGDGLEDRAELFWDNQGKLRAPIGMALTPKDYKHGQGAFVASKGKCSLIVDTDHDDRADKELIVAQGWKELGHGVDALGVAFDDRDGSVWFGLGTENFTNGYLIDGEGKAKYHLKNERGTILRVAPDFQSREIFCTGIRFPVALRFNQRGDLFCTDQEGATWLPNGNPFDELLHVQRDRHYGFPPRHPQHLPNVIDEPSTFDYGPQHQSTCGLNFNEPVRGGPIFGPASWRGDAFVTGYSRGKLYRTQLVPTERGYVAQNHLLASVNGLPCDACVSPTGDLVVAVHSGKPDWGSGPGGKGKLYKIRYADKIRPLPVLAWSAGQRQVRIAFDRPLAAADLEGLSNGIRCERGPWLGAGDRFETYRPGYAVVQQQQATVRHDLPIHGVSVTPDRRSIVLETAPQQIAEQYGITLKRRERTASSSPTTNKEALPQVSETDLHFTLNGIWATFANREETVWSGWLPHLDLKVADAFTATSAPHDDFRKWATEAQTLTLRTQLDLHHLLRPAVQPGSTLDYEPSAESVTVVLRASAKITVTADSERIKVKAFAEDPSLVHLVVDQAPRDLLPIEITLTRRAAGDRFSLSPSWHSKEDGRARPFPLRRFFLPWANKTDSSAALERSLAQRPPELEGGSWGRGRRLFFSEKALCSKCHHLGERAGTLGPNLANLRHRDYQSVLRDVLNPSDAINPDHLSYQIALTDGRVLTGLVKQEAGKLLIGTEKAETISIDPRDVETMVPSKLSIMPQGIDKLLQPEELRDLMTFLIGPPPNMPSDRPGAPPARSRREVAEVLAGSQPAKTPPRQLRIVLVAGPKDHGPGEHDYPAWLETWAELFRAAENVTVIKAMEWPEAEDLATADALVFYQKGSWDETRAKAMDEFLKRGGGVSYVHYAVDGGNDPLGFAERIGLAWQGGASRFRHGPLDLVFDAKHPISRNFKRLGFEDESYWNLKGDPQKISLLASGREENSPQPLIWCREHHKGRVFVSIPGHYSWTFDDPLFRVLLLRGIAWSAGEPVDRFNELTTLGIELQDSHPAGAK